MNDLVYRLRKRAEIRRQIPGRKSVEEGKPDRIADILEEAANEIERLREFAEQNDNDCAPYTTTNQLGDGLTNLYEKDIQKSNE